MQLLASKVLITQCCWNSHCPPTLTSWILIFLKTSYRQPTGASPSDYYVSKWYIEIMLLLIIIIVLNFILHKCWRATHGKGNSKLFLILFISVLLWIYENVSMLWFVKHCWRMFPRGLMHLKIIIPKEVNKKHSVLQNDLRWVHCILHLLKNNPFFSFNNLYQKLPI